MIAVGVVKEGVVLQSGCHVDVAAAASEATQTTRTPERREEQRGSGAARTTASHSSHLHILQLRLKTFYCSGTHLTPQFCGAA